MRPVRFLEEKINEYFKGATEKHGKESKTNQKGAFMLLKRVSKFYDKYLIKVSATGFEDAEVTFDYQKDTSDKAANYVVEKKDVGIILLKKKNQ